MDRAFSNVTLKTVSEDRRELEGWASRPSTDRVGDQVMPEGAIFELPLPFLLDHDHQKVVGEVYQAEVSSTGIRFWARIRKIAEPGAAKDLVDYAWSLIRNNLRSVVSIGFRSLSHEPIPGGGLRFTSWEWYELSAVGVAAQPEARITGTKTAGQIRNPVVRLSGASKPSTVVKLNPVERARINGTLKIHVAPRNKPGEPFKIHKVHTRPPIVKLSQEECPWLHVPRKLHPVFKLSARPSNRHRVVKLRPL